MTAAPQICVGAVIVDDGRLLLVRRSATPAAGTWSIPGGRVEPGETVAEAVVREVAEETGLEGLCGALLGWGEIIDDAHHYVVLDFVVDVLEPADLQAGSDASEAAWVDLDEVAELPLAEGLAEFLHEHGVIDVIV